MKNQKQTAWVSWIIWFVFLQSAFFSIYFLSGEFSAEGGAQAPFPVWVGALSLFALITATLLRWVLLRKPLPPQQQIVAMVVGLALSEWPLFLALFLLGEHPPVQVAILMLAVLSIIQFAPSYATPGVSQWQEA